MTLPSSGYISLQAIRNEFGGDAPHYLSEYYRNGGYVTSNNGGVPTSGPIWLSQFYGAQGVVAGAADYGTPGTYYLVVPAFNFIQFQCWGGGGGGGGNGGATNGPVGGGGAGGTSHVSNILHGYGGGGAGSMGNANWFGGGSPVGGGGGADGGNQRNIGGNSGGDNTGEWNTRWSGPGGNGANGGAGGAAVYIGQYTVQNGNGGGWPGGGGSGGSRNVDWWDYANGWMNTTCWVGGGGGGGGYAHSVYNPSQIGIGSTLTIVVGAGGSPMEGGGAGAAGRVYINWG